MMENNDKHTPEPWIYGEDNDGFFIEPLRTGNTFDSEQLVYALRDADAKRIVACVNACAGVETELLVMAKDPIVPLVAIFEYSKLNKKYQNQKSLITEMLAALKHAQEWAGHHGAVLRKVESVIERAEEFIGKE